jgi:tetratricopeptide (TPR) repeat protein
MSETRLNALLQYYSEDPSDPFNAYAVANEYMKTDATKAREFFDVLLDKHPNYLPTYYHAAKLYQELNVREKAIAIFEKGIALAKQTNEFKTLRELQSAYDEFLFE